MRKKVLCKDGLMYLINTKIHELLSRRRALHGKLVQDCVHIQ